MLRRSRSTLTVVGLLISLGGCSAILGIEPTNVLGGEGGDGGEIGGEGGVSGEGGTTGDGGKEGGVHHGDGGGGDTPAIDPACATAITTLDANGEETSAIVADADGVYWALPQDSSTSLIYSNASGSNELIVGTDDGDSNDDTPTVLGLALDGNNLYVSGWNTYNDELTHPPTIFSYGRHGSHDIVQVNLTAAGRGVSEIALVNGYLYWANWKTFSTNAHIWSIPVPFTNATALNDETGGTESPYHFTGSKLGDVFYDQVTPGGSLTSPQSQVGVLHSNGGPVDIDTTSSEQIEDLAADENSTVYWPDTNNHVVRKQPLGGSTTALYTAAATYPHLLAYDADHQLLYVATSSQDDVYSIQRISTSGGSLSMCVDNLQHVYAVHYFGGHLYFSARSDSGSALFDLTTKN